MSSKNFFNQQLSRNHRDRVSQQHSWIKSLVAIALLLGSAGLILSIFWFSLQLFLNPDAIIWVNQFLPTEVKIPVVYQDRFQTLAQIRTKVSQQGQILGELLTLESNPDTLQPKTILLPVLDQQPNCQTDCQQIVELRVYQLAFNQDDNQINNQESSYQLVSKLPVEGPEESQVIAPLMNTAIAYYGSNRSLPLTQLHRFAENTPTTGIWLYLYGQRVQGVSAIAYGQIVHYNPQRSYLSFMMPWTSPTGQVPQWQQVTGSGFPELFIDETVDLEPQLHVYQVKPAPFYLNPIQLEPISLLEPALNSSAYENALFLARNGLWSPAGKWLQFIKRQRRQQRESWSVAAQAQMDLIELYAQRTQSQAQNMWASPSQAVLADLIDGRWSKALQVFQASPANAEEIATLLAADSGRLWNRVTAALRVNPQRPEVQAWGALIRAAQDGRTSAITWLNQQPQTTPTTIASIKTLLDRLEGNNSY